MAKLVDAPCQSRCPITILVRACGFEPRLGAKIQNMGDCAFNYSGSKSGYTELHSITETVVDVFGGGGGFWSWVNSSEVFVNDANKELIMLQKAVHGISDDNFELLVARLYELTSGVNSREEYEALRAEFNKTKNPLYFMALLSCCTNNMIRYNKSGGFNQTWGRRKFNQSMEKKLRDFRARIRGKSVTFMHGDFRRVPHYVDRPLYFIDPPYYISGNTYGVWTEKDECDLYMYIAGKRFIMTNFMRRGDAVNTILADFIAAYGWPHRVLRTGKMRAQRDTDQTYEEVIVADSEETMSIVKLTE